MAYHSRSRYSSHSSDLDALSLLGGGAVWGIVVAFVLAIGSCLGIVAAALSSWFGVAIEIWRAILILIAIAISGGVLTGRVIVGVLKIKSAGPFDVDEPIGCGFTMAFSGFYFFIICAIASLSHHNWWTACLMIATAVSFFLFLGERQFSEAFKKAALGSVPDRQTTVDLPITPTRQNSEATLGPQGIRMSLLTERKDHKNLKLRLIETQANGRPLAPIVNQDLDCLRLSNCDSDEVRRSWLLSHLPNARAAKDFTFNAAEPGGNRNDAQGVEKKNTLNAISSLTPLCQTLPASSAPDGGFLSPAFLCRCPRCGYVIAMDKEMFIENRIRCPKCHCIS